MGDLPAATLLLTTEPTTFLVIAAPSPSYLLCSQKRTEHDGDEDPGQCRPPAIWSPQLCLGNALPNLQDKYAGETQSHQETVWRGLEVSYLPQHAPAVHLLHDCSPL